MRRGGGGGNGKDEDKEEGGRGLGGVSGREWMMI